MAYISGVSGAGFLMSVYYFLFWDPGATGVTGPLATSSLGIWWGYRSQGGHSSYPRGLQGG